MGLETASDLRIFFLENGMNVIVLLQPFVKDIHVYIKPRPGPLTPSSDRGFYHSYYYTLSYEQRGKKPWTLFQSPTYQKTS